jgi:preprotein translocase subunit SecE
MIQKIRKFITDVRAEFRKVTWPTRDQTIKQTGVVLVLVALTSVFLGVVDLGLSELYKLIMG